MRFMRTSLVIRFLRSGEDMDWNAVLMCPSAVLMCPSDVESARIPGLTNSRATPIVSVTTAPFADA